MGFFTDSALAKLSATEGCSAEETETAVADADAVYRYVERVPGTTEAKLRNWGEGQGIDPDRMNVALALLRETGKLFSMADPGPLAPEPAPTGEADRPRSRRTSASTKGKK